jgi:hypothetical protein
LVVTGNGLTGTGTDFQHLASAHLKPSQLANNKVTMKSVINKTSTRLSALKIYLNHALKAFTQLRDNFDRSVACTEAKAVQLAISEVIETINISALYINDSCGPLVLGIIDQAEQMLYWKIQSYINSDELHLNDYKARYESLQLSKRYMINYYLALRSGDARLACLWAKAVKLCDPPPLRSYSPVPNSALNNFPSLCGYQGSYFRSFIENEESMLKSEPKECHPFIMLFISAARYVRANIVLELLVCENDEMQDMSYFMNEFDRPQRKLLQKFNSDVSWLFIEENSLYSSVSALVRRGLEDRKRQNWSEGEELYTKHLYRLAYAKVDVTLRKTCCACYQNNFVNKVKIQTLLEKIEVSRALASIGLESAGYLSFFRHLAPSIKEELQATCRYDNLLADFKLVEVRVQDLNQRLQDSREVAVNGWAPVLSAWSSFDESTAPLEENGSLILPGSFSEPVEYSTNLQTIKAQSVLLVKEFLTILAQLLQYGRVFEDLLSKFASLDIKNQIQDFLRDIVGMVQHGFVNARRVVEENIDDMDFNIFDDYDDYYTTEFFCFCNTRVGALRHASTLLDEALEAKEVRGDLMLASLLESYGKCVAEAVTNLVVADDADMEQEADAYNVYVSLVEYHKLCLLLYERYKMSKGSPARSAPCAADIWFALFYIASYILDNLRYILDLAILEVDITPQVQWIRRTLKTLLTDIIQCVDDALKAAESGSSTTGAAVLPHVCYVLQQVAEFVRMGLTVERHQEIMRAVIPTVATSSSAENVFADPIQQYHKAFPNTIISPTLLRNVHSHYEGFGQSSTPSSSSSGSSDRFSREEHCKLRLFAVLLMMRSCSRMFNLKHFAYVLDGTVSSLLQVAHLSFEYAHCKKVIPLSSPDAVWEYIAEEEDAFAKTLGKVLDAWPMYQDFDTAHLPGSSLLWERSAGFALCALNRLTGSNGSKNSQSELMKTLKGWKSGVQLLWHLILTFLQSGQLKNGHRSLSQLIVYSVLFPIVDVPGEMYCTLAHLLVTSTVQQLHCEEVGSVSAAMRLNNANAQLWSAWEALNEVEHDDAKCGDMIAAAKEEALRVVCPCPQCSPVELAPAAAAPAAAAPAAAPTDTAASNKRADRSSNDSASSSSGSSSSNNNVVVAAAASTSNKKNAERKKPVVSKRSSK